MRAILQLSLTLATVVLFMSLAARGQQGSTNPVELAQTGGPPSRRSATAMPSARSPRPRS